MTVGFTGTRQGLRDPQAATVRRLLTTFWLLAQGQARQFDHGDCTGADADAHAIARQTGYTVHTHPMLGAGEHAAHTDADLRHDPLPPLTRNHVIVDVSTVMIAAPGTLNEQPRGSGTWATIRYAKKVGKPLFIVNLYGEVAVF